MATAIAAVHRRSLGGARRERHPRSSASPWRQEYRLSARLRRGPEQRPRELARVGAAGTARVDGARPRAALPCAAAVRRESPRSPLPPFARVKVRSARWASYLNLRCVVMVRPQPRPRRRAENTQALRRVQESASELRSALHTGSRQVRVLARVPPDRAWLPAALGVR